MSGRSPGQMDVLTLFGMEKSGESTPLPLDPRERFAALLEKLKEGLDLPTLQRELEDELLATYRERFPRSRPKMPEEPGKRWAKIRKLGEKFQEEFNEIVERRTSEVEGELEQLDERKKGIEKELESLAKELEPQVSGESRKVYEVGTYAYHTQGMGAAKYARGEAERQAGMLEREGFEVEIREIPGSRDRWGIRSCEFEVWAPCSELDYEIVKRRAAFSFKDRLQWCWNRGLNPRVYWPGLPHGLEEKLGVSFLVVRDGEGNVCP